jgi:formylglycine-generating enzyme required for sulfatase activity
MSDIFLSYDSKDLDRVKVLAEALESQGWTVFFDRTTTPGETQRHFINKEIDECRCMVVVWSTHSINSNLVKVEADIGLNRKIFIQLLLDQVIPPLEFGFIQAANLAGWMGETDSSGYLALCDTLTELIGPEIPTVSDIDKTNHHSNNEQKNAEFRWSKQLTVKIGKITVIAASLAILLWYIMIPGVFSHKNEPEVTNQLLIKEPEMLSIPAGSFQMGSNNGNYDEKPIHPVKLKSFAIGRYEVTFEEYDQFAEVLGKPKPDDNGWGRGNRPVINVSFEDAVAYAQWLSLKTGKHYHLPTEEQWEYAARAGTTSDYYWEGKGEAKDFAWFDENSEGKTHPVGMKKPNAFGVYDMSGNVWEWVQDCPYDYAQAPNNDNCSWRALRGGSWNYEAGLLRSATRFRYFPANRFYFLGFRLAQD